MLVIKTIVFHLIILLLNGSLVVEGFHVAKNFCAIRSSLPSPVALQTSSFIPDEINFKAVPNPDLDAVAVVTLCMDALKNKSSNESLEICFDFSSDRCRAAVGGTLQEFVQYASNPIFGTLINCDHYEILKIGPVIPGGPHRGAMQTVLVEIQKGVTIRDAVEAGKKNARKRPTIEERLRQREMEAQGINEENEDEVAVDDGRRKFLWTLQKERRPPRQDCWLVHEVLFTKNAWQLTL